MKTAWPVSEDRKGAWPLFARKTQAKPGSMRLGAALALALAIGAGQAVAATCTSVASGNWSLAGTWSCVGAPAATRPGQNATDTAIVAATHTVTGNFATTIAALTVNAGGVLNMQGVNLTVNGAIGVSGTMAHTAAGGTKIYVGPVTVNAGGIWNNTANQAIAFRGGITHNGTTFNAGTGTQTFNTNSQALSGASAMSFGGAVAVAGAVTLTNNNSNTVTISGNLTGSVAGSTFVNAANATLNYGGANAPMATGVLTATASPNTINFNRAGAQTLKQATYHHLTLSGSGTKSSGAITLQVNGTTTVTGTATFNISSTTGTKTFVGPVVVDAGCSWTNTANEAVLFRGGITHNGTTFSAGTGLQTFNTGSQALAGSSAMTFGGAVTVSGAIALTNNNSNTVRIDGNLNGSMAGSTYVNGANATLDYRGANVPMTTGVLTANASPNTVNYNRAGNQTVKLPSAGYYHLTLSNSGIKTAPAGTLTVLGNLTVNAGPTFTANANDPVINVTGNATIDGIYTASNNAARPLTIGGSMSVGGTYTGNVAPVNLAGNFTRTGTFTSGAGVFTFNGSALQTLTGATTFTNLTVNNTGSGLSLANDITATTAAAGVLVLTAGPVATGSNNLIVARSCTVPSVTRTNGWVAGNLRLAFPTGTPSCTFHVGDATDYRPIGMLFASVTTAGSLTGTVSQSAGDHPNIATSGLDAAKGVNRYWTLTNPGGIAFTTYTATFNFIAGDIDGGATATSFEIERWNGAWNTTTLGTAGATSTSASSLPSFGAGVSNSFAVGEKKGPTVVSINLASTDPTSPGTSVDWTVTFSASVTGVDSTDFALVMGGGLSGATITGVSGSGTTWTVTANTGSGAGTLGLNR